MSELVQRLSQNVPGAYYVDATCVDCDQCRAIAPQFFRRHDDIGASVVFHQRLDPMGSLLPRRLGWNVRATPSATMEWSFNDELNLKKMVRLARMDVRGGAIILMLPPFWMPKPRTAG